MKRFICLSLLAGSLLVLPMTIRAAGPHTTPVCITGKFRNEGHVVNNLPVSVVSRLVSGGIACTNFYPPATNGTPCTSFCDK